MLHYITKSFYLRKYNTVILVQGMLGSNISTIPVLLLFLLLIQISVHELKEPVVNSDIYLHIFGSV